ncbi:MAG: iron chelate uptake ABC transporter family permease subunit [Nocardioidaceae bacterium]
MTSRIVVRPGSWSWTLTRRTTIVTAATVVFLAGFALWAMTLGDYGLSARQVFDAVLGRATDPLGSYFVRELRAPRVVAALLVGAALGVSGSLFQNVTRNPLGSPDIIGFTIGSATGALVQIILVGAAGNAVAAGALVGGLATAATVLLLARPHGLTDQRLVLIGIGVGATLAAANTLLVVRASLEAAQRAGFWLAGSLNAVLWPKVAVAAAAIVPLVVAAGLLHRPLSQLSLGDQTARASGIDVDRVRLLVVVVGVALVSVATATTGPIAFVALAAPQVSRRLAGSPLPGVVGPAVTGAAIVLVADLIAQRLFAPTELAAGIITGALGGVYLIGLLAAEGRKR